MRYERPKKEHWDPLAHAIEYFLTDVAEFGSTIVPSRNNAGKIADMAMAAAERGDPVVVALSDNDGIAGFCLWMEITTGLEYTGRELQALGTWVHPAFRGRGIGKELRIVATSLARTAGFARLVGTVHVTNELGKVSLKSQPWKVVAEIVHREL